MKPPKKKVGRPVGSKNKATDPLVFLTQVMLGQRQADAMQLRAAIAAAQYVHTKTHDGGKKDMQVEEALKAAGRFAGVGTPPRLVSSR